MRVLNEKTDAKGGRLKTSALNIHYLRVINYYTTTEMAELLGTFQPLIVDYESGKTGIGIDMAKRICKTFGLSLDTFYNKDLRTNKRREDD